MCISHQTLVKLSRERLCLFCPFICYVLSFSLNFLVYVIFTLPAPCCFSLYNYEWSLINLLFAFLFLDLSCRFECSLRAVLGGKGMATANRNRPRTPLVEVDAAPPQRGSSPFYYLQHVKHQLVSLQATPRIPVSTPRAVSDLDGVPEGLFATEGGQLSASFSLAPTRADERNAPLITSVDMTFGEQLVEGGAHSVFAVCVGDSTGRIDHLETRPQSSTQKLFRKHSHQAFVGEFDCLTSSPVNEKVHCLRYLPNRSPGMTSYLAANERTIKLFRIRQEVPPVSLLSGSANKQTLRSSDSSPASRSPVSLIPSSTPRVQKRIVMPSKAFTGPHKSPIQDVSLCADGETFLSVDDLQVHWWSLEASGSTKSTCITDLTPPSGDLDDVSQLLTSASFHPSHGSLFLIGRSNGALSIGDLRDPPSRKLRRFNVEFQLLSSYNEVQHKEHNDILTSVSSAAMVGDNFVVSRDYFGLKLWDVRNPVGPVSRVSMMSSLAPHLDDLYESDTIFDRFPVVVDSSSFTIATGCYGGIVAVWQPSESDGLEFYATDPYVPPSEAENGGKISTPEVESLFSKGLCEDHVARKVMCLAIAPGGQRFCCCTTDHFFLFCRQPA